MVLQLCMEWHWFWPWFKRMVHCQVDFSVDVGGDGVATYYQQMRTPYNLSQGPLWRARLVPLEGGTQENNRHKAVLVLTLHHLIIDGLTNMVISREVLKVLNASMVGEEYEPQYQGVTPAISDEMIGWREWPFAVRTFLSSSRSILVGMLDKNSVTNILPSPRPKLPVTTVLQHDFTAETTQQLMKTCKEASVSVNSCLTAAANLAMLHTVIKHSKGRVNSANITYDNAVNLRRYYDSVYQECLGNHATIEVQQYTIRTSDATKEGFWALAKLMQKDLVYGLDVTRSPLKTPILGPALAILVPINYFLTRCGLKNFVYVHVTCTNMGNLKHLLPGKYNNGPVEITRLLRSTASEYTGNACVVDFQTFEGQLMMSLDCFTTKIDEDVANQFFSTLTRYITEVAESGCITLQEYDFM